MIEFDADEIARSLDVSYTQVIRETALLFLQSVTIATPVGNPSRWAPQSLPPPPGYVGGRARGNWQVSIGGPETSELDVIDKSGGPTIARGNTRIKAYRKGSRFTSIFIQNNVPYINRLNNGHSKAMAAGFVERAAAVAARGARLSGRSEL